MDGTWLRSAVHNNLSRFKMILNSRWTPSKCTAHRTQSTQRLRIKTDNRSRNLKANPSLESRRTAAAVVDPLSQAIRGETEMRWLVTTALKCSHLKRS